MKAVLCVEHGPPEKLVVKDLHLLVPLSPKPMAENLERQKKEMFG